MRSQLATASSEEHISLPNEAISMGATYTTINGTDVARLNTFGKLYQLTQLFHNLIRTAPDNVRLPGCTWRVGSKMIGGSLKKTSPAPEKELNQLVNSLTID